MGIQRLDRRIRILRGKRKGAFDRGQYYHEQAPRSAVARRVRSALRRMQPVVLVTPRWSLAQRFLDDVAVELAVGRPDVQCRTLSLLPLQGRTVHESWTWLAYAFAGFCGIPIDGPLSTAVDRIGFRHVMAGLFRRSLRGPPRAMLVHGLEHLHVEARNDLVRVFEEHVSDADDERRINLLLAGSVDAPSFGIEGGARLSLPDFAEPEALEALVEYVGLSDRAPLQQAVSLLGGVPALIDRVGAEAETQGEVPFDREGIWRALGPLADEIRGAVSIVSSVDGLADRLELVARDGPQPEDEQCDPILLRAGLFEPVPGHVAQVRVRAPIFTDLAGWR